LFFADKDSVFWPSRLSYGGVDRYQIPDARRN
jgi:hypothetical protein